MSVLAFEILKHFYEALKLKRDSDNRTWRSLLLYILPQYMLSLVIVGVCVILNYTVDGVVDYGRHFSGLCWITVPTAILMLICSPFWHYDHVQYVCFYLLSCCDYKDLEIAVEV